MNETAKTLSFAGVAVILLGAAALASWLPEWQGRDAEFKELGTAFFPELQEKLEEEPLTIKALEVVGFDEETFQYQPFKVELKDGEWIIPSHHNYPADAAEKLARLGAQVARMKRDAIRSDYAQDHEELGVVDPLGDPKTTFKGRGTRVKLFEIPDGDPIAEFILGDVDDAQENLRFVRLPEQNRVYSAQIELDDLSTEFADWIDTDLLDITSAEVTKLEFETRRVDPDLFRRTGKVVLSPADPLFLEKEAPPADESMASPSWSLNDLLPDEEVDDSKVSGVISAVDNLRIIGVRPLPESDEDSFKSMLRRGFYPVNMPNGDEGLLSNEGGVILDTDSGIRYDLRFGELFLATGKAVSAGEGEEQDPSASEEEDSSTEETSEDGESNQIEGRYLLVSVSFDPSLIPAEEEEETDPNALPDDLFARAKDDPVRLEAEAKAAEETARKARDRQRQIEEGREKAAELQEAFGTWYYVVTGDDFREVIVDRSNFIKDPESEPISPNPTPGFNPGGFQPGGLPGFGNP